VHKFAIMKEADVLKQRPLCVMDPLNELSKYDNFRKKIPQKGSIQY
jgi:hypothetical protein